MIGEKYSCKAPILMMIVPKLNIRPMGLWPLTWPSEPFSCNLKPFFRCLCLHRDPAVGYAEFRWT